MSITQERLDLPSSNLVHAFDLGSRIHVLISITGSRVNVTTIQERPHLPSSNLIHTSWAETLLSFRLLK